MVVFPNAKINLGLNVISKRADGYHNIESCFCPIEWSDILEIIPSNKFSFTSSGLTIDGDVSNNLCVKAYDLLRENYDFPAVGIHLHKVIPMGAGLGGGSSDGAHVLKVLNDLFDLGISNAELQNFAKSLGSDCPFFINNKPSLVSGVGDEISPFNFSLDKYQLLVVYPNLHIPTKIAFQGVKPQPSLNSIESILIGNSNEWKTDLKNDFENSINDFPDILYIKNALYDHGSIYASMSGSGSAVYGLFSEDINLNRIKKSMNQYLIWQG